MDKNNGDQASLEDPIGEVEIQAETVTIGLKPHNPSIISNDFLILEQKEETKLGCLQ